MVAWFDYVAGAASILGFFAAFYFYFRQRQAEQRQRQAEQVTKGFYTALQNQAFELRNHLLEAKAIANHDYFDVLKARVDTSLSAATALLKNVEVYRETLWPTSD